MTSMTRNGARINLKIELIKDKCLSDNYFILRNLTYDLTRRNGEVVRHKREVYDRGNGATVLLYNPQKQSVVLIRQFRIATWVNGNPDGRLIETCAGLLDNDEPIREARLRGSSSVSISAEVALSSPASRVAISARTLLPLPPGPVTSRKSCQS